MVGMEMGAQDAGDGAPGERTGEQGIPGLARRRDVQAGVDDGDAACPDSDPGSPSSRIHRLI